MSATAAQRTPSKRKAPEASPCGVTPPVSPRSSSKRKVSDLSGAGPSSRRASRVRFSHVTIQEMGMEIWGGGGVPADDGPPLGLSWDLQSTRHVHIDEFEDERQQSRTPKDSYCVEGCMEPNLRRQMLLAAGSTHKQIKAATKAVAQLNQDRWKVTRAAPSPERTPPKIICGEERPGPAHAFMHMHALVTLAARARLCGLAGVGGDLRRRVALPRAAPRRVGRDARDAWPARRSRL